MLNDLDDEVRAVKNQAMEITWHSKGAVTYEEALNMGADDRLNWFKFIEKKYEEQSNQDIMRQETF